MKSMESVKGKLKYRAQKANRLYSEILITYMLERLIYRVSISKYSNNFILKGGILLYALYNEDFPRATADVDFLGKGITNEISKVKKIFEEILSVEYYNDFIKYDLNTIEVVAITEFKEYHGVNISVMSYLGNSKNKVSIDIGYGDIIYPKEIEIEFPSLLEEDVAKIYVYSLASVVSEKYEAIVSLGELNSRLKDFYDIYLLSKTNKFESSEIYNALESTFLKRNTKYEDIVIYEHEFRNSKAKQTQWKVMMKKKNITNKVDFSIVIRQIELFVLPIIEMIKTKKLLDRTWDTGKSQWM